MRLGIALQKVYDFIWEEFCDWYIEMVKPRLWDDNDTTKAAALWTLKTVLINSAEAPSILICRLSQRKSSVTFRMRNHPS